MLNLPGMRQVEEGQACDTGIFAFFLLLFWKEASSVRLISTELRDSS